MRPVIYYLKHLLQDMDEEKMLSRALISYVRFDHPQTIMHPILAFCLDLLWEKLVGTPGFFRSRVNMCYLLKEIHCTPEI